MNPSDFSSEEPTQPIVFDIAQAAATWREQLRLEQKTLRSIGSDDETQRLAVCR